MALYERHWPAVSGRAVVVLVHGAAEHCGRYDHVAKHFNAAGFGVLGFDLPGLGQSPGRRGHVDSFEDYLQAVDHVITRAADLYPELPIVLYGHSMGGLITVRWLQTRSGLHKQLLRGVILTSPCLDLSMKVPSALHRVAVMLERVWPTMSQSSGIPAKHVSRDADVVAKYVTDPLMVPKVTVKWYMELYRNMEEARGNAVSFSIPTLILQAGDDRIVSSAATRDFAVSLVAPDKEFHELPGLYHEVHNEPEREDVLNTMTAFLDRTLFASQPAV